ncbi:MATE family efflux transporter [Flammeovirga agarivorans]|uniref:Multidrug-efflux transporter n=1 Tax=Flammeovirga agarivorans TaxID=2726742 RepID=A0A7X8XYD9_9BACT|nr:MATE family efflux transporter [Flammeovirga agarivorans]NLR94127.1 MATE family efflux transporter [Flammeovirga agarivorans]
MKGSQKSFYQEVWKVALPISLQSVLQYALSMVDQIMVGQLGETVIASVGLGSRLSFIFMVALIGTANGAGVFVAQFWGKGEKQQISYLLGDLIKIGTLVTVLGMFLSIAFPSEILSLFSSDKEVIALGGIYQQIIALGFPAVMLSAAYSSSLRSIGEAKLVLKISLWKIVMNTILNYILIFGGLGFEGLGMEGAAWATIIAMWFETFALIYIVRSKGFPGDVRWKHILHWDKSSLMPLLSVSAPLVLGEISWAAGETGYSMIYGQMGTVDIAAMTMTIPLQVLFFGFFTGLASAASIVIGYQLGQNNIRKAKIYGDKLSFNTFLLGILMGLFVVLISPLYIKVYEVTPEVKDLTQILCYIFAFLFPIKMTNYITAAGVLRSGGDTKFTTTLGLFTTWLFSIPLGVFAAFYLELPLEWVYVIVSIEEYVRLGLYLWRKRTGKWARNLVNEQ